MLTKCFPKNQTPVQKQSLLGFGFCFAFFFCLACINASGFFFMPKNSSLCRSQSTKKKCKQMLLAACFCFLGANARWFASKLTKKPQKRQTSKGMAYLFARKAKKKQIRVLLTCAFCFRQRRVVAIIKGLYGVFSGTPCVGSFNKKQKQLLSNKKKSVLTSLVRHQVPWRKGNKIVPQV